VDSRKSKSSWRLRWGRFHGVRKGFLNFLLPAIDHMDSSSKSQDWCSWRKLGPPVPQRVKWMSKRSHLTKQRRWTRNPTALLETEKW
jgi:hypothetical protein